MGGDLAIQVAADERRILWMAHESAPKTFTGLDVTDPHDPKMVVQTVLPEPFMRFNPLELTGNLTSVAYRRVIIGTSGLAGAGPVADAARRTCGGVTARLWFGVSNVWRPRLSRRRTGAGVLY